MRFFHLSDLHIGKQLHYYNLKENQRAVFNQIIKKAEKYRPDAILISGDIFDRSVPSGEAYTVFDEFLNELAGLKPQIPILIIAGNHDNPQRLSYAKSFLEKNQIYVSVLPPQKPTERLKCVELSDRWGKVNFWLMPFLKPSYIRQLFEEEKITDYHTAVAALLEREGLDGGQIETKHRNVLLSHQFYVNGQNKPQTSDSEQYFLQVGGIDAVDVSLVEHFDYVALGHIHGAQQIKRPHIRYCGTPLKYSVSEENQEKSITMVTLEEKGTSPKIETIPLIPLQEVRSERGTLQEILGRATEENRHDFISVTVTDEKEPYHLKERLEECYDYILELQVDNQRTRDFLQEKEEREVSLSPMEVFESFYQEMQGQVMSKAEKELMIRLFHDTREEAQ